MCVPARHTNTFTNCITDVQLFDAIQTAPCYTVLDFFAVERKKRMINVQVLLPGINVFLPHLSNQISPVFYIIHYQIEKRESSILPHIAVAKDAAMAPGGSGGKKHLRSIMMLQQFSSKATMQGLKSII